MTTKQEINLRMVNILPQTIIILYLINKQGFPYYIFVDEQMLS
jgi:hypothetical protein